jgi:uncharacterized membrane protein YbhN (UPF0104 family)
VNFTSIIGLAHPVTGLWTTLTTAAKLVTHVRSGFVLAALAAFLAGVTTVAFRWRFLLAALGTPTSAWNTFLTYSAGVCVGNVNPARTVGGDAVRLALIRSRTNASMSVATASIVYDRLSEVPAITIVALLALANLRSSSTVVIAVLAAAAMALAAGPVRRALFSRISRWHDTLVGIPLERSTIATIIGLSIVVWSFDLTRTTLVAAAFGVTLSPTKVATLAGFRLLSGLIPIPGGVGVVEGGLIGGLVLFGVSTETATAITIVERAVMYGCGTLLGAASLVLVGGLRMLRARPNLANPENLANPANLVNPANPVR